MRRKVVHLSPLLSGILGTVAATLILAAALTPDLPAAPPRHRAVSSGGAALIDAAPSPLQGMKLDWLRKEMSASKSRRRAAVDRLLRGERGDAPTLHRWLHRTTKLSPADYRNLLRHVGAHVPDRRGRFGQAPARSPDWLESLLALEPDKLPAHLRAAHCDTLLNVALLRALVASKHPDAAVSLLRFAYRHLSAFKDECGRQIRAMRVHAVPGLVRTQALRDPLAYKMVRYAAYQLDRIDCVRPDRALKQSDPDLKVEILHAYGEVRDPTAVTAVLRHTDATSPRVRRAARWAMLRYVSGRPPRVVRRKLKLAGGRQSSTVRTVYLTYRQLAYHAVADRLARELHAAPETQKGGFTESTRRPLEEIRRSLREEGEPRFLAERLFALMDHKRKHAREQALARALEQAAAGKLEPALREFNRQLALDPYHPRREELALFYYQRGKQMHQQGQHRRAVVLLTKAIHLAPDGKFVSDARARRNLAEVMLDGGPGGARDAERKLHAAATFSPDLHQGRTSLAALERRRHQRLWIIGGIACSFVLLLTFALTRLRRRLYL